MKSFASSPSYESKGLKLPLFIIDLCETDQASIIDVYGFMQNKFFQACGHLYRTPSAKDRTTYFSPIIFPDGIVMFIHTAKVMLIFVISWIRILMSISYLFWFQTSNSRCCFIRPCITNFFSLRPYRNDDGN